MHIFINLPVADVERAKAFFVAIGWSINENFTDENAACVVIEDDKYLMVLRRDFYQTFLDDKQVGDPATTSLALISFDLPSKGDVDAFVDRVAAAGGVVGRTQDLGFMYQRQFDDPDGNHFEPFWMDPVAAQQGPPAE
ncbi:VOC family protein [Micropruina sp.]|jgi:predicted lactoylglutathione lyase|uniref:VOC family protein n=1 Tax=Micropruina sp. TaxID=2737536 RepID=UPI00260E49DF|nr:VOC family protein [Micropruina sp.]